MTSERLAALDQAISLIREVRSAMSPDTTDAEVLELAQAFARMDDDHQAKFFVEIAKIMKSWGPMGLDNQAHFIGAHLRTCECSTPEAVELIQSIARGTQS